jgi:hypothetical protein
MDIERRAFSSSVPPAGARGGVRRTQSLWRRALPVLAFSAAMCFVLVSITDPTASFAITEESNADEITLSPVKDVDTQTVIVADGAASPLIREQFSATAPPPPPPVAIAKEPSAAKSAGVPDPGSAKAIAYDMVIARGWGQGEYDCLVSLWNKESGWNVNAHNKSSGAHGIPQALPGSKMASAGADWETNPATQITWGLGYITGRYSTPCGAWGKSQSSGWY